MNRKKYIKLSAFTLVELVVVATILAILSAVGFAAYTGYIAGARDTNRIVQTQDIYDGITLYQAKSNLPNPDDSVEIRVGGIVTSYQGYAGENLLSAIGYKKGGKDPQTGDFFTYAINSDKTVFQILTHLEEDSQENLALYKTTYANDYSEKFIWTTGSKLGIFTTDENVPVQEVDQIITDGFLDISSGTTGYIAHLSSEEQLLENELLNANPKQSCKRIKELKRSSKDGSYKINPDGNGEFSVFCDMTTDGGGWTVISYTDDLDFANQSQTGSDGWEWLVDDFNFQQTDQQIDAVRNISSEARQKYISLCNGVVTYFYNGGYAYAFGFRFHTNDTTPQGTDFSTLPEYDIIVPLDICESNGGEGGALNKSTIFEINDIRLPVINVNTRDNGASSEKFGSPLKNNPVFFR